MTASDPGQNELGQPSALTKKNVRFFNVSLRNGIVMSTPSYPEKQAFVAHLIRAIETANPDFAWIQFLFVSSSYGADLIRLKNSMHRAKTAIEQPSLDFVSGQAQDRRELYRDYYSRTEARMKKVDDIVTKPTITMAIQGMWVSDEPESIYALPFDHCSDEHDSLTRLPGTATRGCSSNSSTGGWSSTYREYFDRYTKSRLEPPSFLVTPEELQSYVHLPAGETAASLRSLEGGTSTRAFILASIAGEKAISGSGDDISSELVRLVKVPKNEKTLEDTSVQPLAHLAAPTVRTFELVYSGGKTEVLLSAETEEDMRKYAGLLGLVYGSMKFEKTDPLPPF